MQLHSQLARPREVSIYKAFWENVLHNAIQASEDEFTHMDTHTRTHAVCEHVHAYLHTCNYTHIACVYVHTHTYTYTDTHNYT